jgi:hypothetical protein
MWYSPCSTGASIMSYEDLVSTSRKLVEAYERSVAKRGETLKKVVYDRTGPMETWPKRDPAEFDEED